MWLASAAQVAKHLAPPHVGISLGSNNFKLRFALAVDTATAAPPAMAWVWRCECCCREVPTSRIRWMPIGAGGGYERQFCTWWYRQWWLVRCGPCTAARDLLREVTLQEPEEAAVLDILEHVYCNAGLDFHTRQLPTSTLH